MVEFMVSHLSNSPNNKVIVVDTLTPFPWHLLFSHSRFQQEWRQDSRIALHDPDTFALLYGLFAYGSLEPAINGSTIVIINDFHQTLDIYLHDQTSSYEETILKHHLEVNSIIKSNQTQYELEGTKTPVPEIPAQSDLLKMSAISKFNTHLNSLLTMMSKFCYKTNSMCFLLGHLETKYIPYSTTSQMSDADFYNTSVSYQDKGRVVLVPSYSESNEEKKDDINSKSIDSYLCMRLIFYKDWYHNSPYFAECYPPLEKQNKVVINQAQLRTVFAIKITNFSSKSKYCPIYFDYDDIIYHLDDDNENDSIDLSPGKLIDLSNGFEITSLEQPTSTFSQLETSAMNGTQSETTDYSSPSARNINANVLEDLGEEISQLNNLNSTEIIDESHYEQNEQDNIVNQSDASEVEESEDEMIGTLLAA
ncbi:hypothetical protein G9P44_005607 [Scheffersomyces stipitis]|nr:hypothetical protein G9P44_005607 [Scheffersomyces stipitis]